MKTRPVLPSVPVLLVEDDPGAVRRTREALREGKVCNDLWVVEDGAEAMAFLRREEPYAQAPRPELILLSLEIPGMGGGGVLREVRADPVLGAIPIVVLGATAADCERAGAGSLPAECCVPKPVGLHELMTVVKAIGGFGLAIVRSPARAR